MWIYRNNRRSKENLPLKKAFLVVQGEVVEEALVTLVGMIMQELNVNFLSLIEVEWTLPYMMRAALYMCSI